MINLHLSWTIIESLKQTNGIINLDPWVSNSLVSGLPHPPLRSRTERKRSLQESTIAAGELGSIPWESVDPDRWRVEGLDTVTLARLPRFAFPKT